MILVTGATGNVGRNVVAQLVAGGLEVRALTRDPARARTYLPEGVEVVAGDLTRPETLPAALTGVERAFLFPVHGHLHDFLEIGRRQGLERVVLLSSSSVTQEPPNAIGTWHAESEAAVAASELSWTFVRPGAFMTNDLRWMPQIESGGVVRAPYGQAAMAPIDERDIAAVAVAALLQDGHAGQAYTLTGPESLTQVERVAILASVLERDLTFEEQTPEELRQQGAGSSPISETLLGLLAERVGKRAEISDVGPRVTGSPAHTYAQWADHHRADFSPRGRLTGHGTTQDR
jgi:uncharacterized protein YbjT (DUF2867 family)